MKTKLTSLLILLMCVSIFALQPPQKNISNGADLLSYPLRYNTIQLRNVFRKNIEPDNIKDGSLTSVLFKDDFIDASSMDRLIEDGSITIIKANINWFDQEIYSHATLGLRLRFDERYFELNGSDSLTFKSSFSDSEIYFDGLNTLRLKYDTKYFEFNSYDSITLTESIRSEPITFEFLSDVDTHYLTLIADYEFDIDSMAFVVDNAQCTFTIKINNVNCSGLVDVYVTTTLSGQSSDSQYTVYKGDRVEIFITEEDIGATKLYGSLFYTRR